ncbi:MAG TPA: cupin domain-containing protein [Vicinamibacterales bacterium]|nr:cupin domain-containing protein [Vicinamibacterales bacterium]
MTLTRVERWDVRRDGLLSEAALQRKIEALGFDVAARIYPAGVSAITSVHDRVCLAGVVRGVVKLTVDDDPVFLAAGDLAFVPRGAVRRIEVVGPETALCLEAFPRAEPATPGSPAATAADVSADRTGR